jgi:hypothetical protein
MILYLIYGKGLVHIPQGSNEDGGAYVDDNIILATGIDYEECDARLNKMDKQDLWTAAHNSMAEISKYQVYS